MLTAGSMAVKSRGIAPEYLPQMQGYAEGRQQQPPRFRSHPAQKLFRICQQGEPGGI